MSVSGETARHLLRVLRDPTPPGDRYEILGSVGQGGMGVVYRAVDRVLDREVALKVLRPELAGPDEAARLEREARILARLEHPGIVPIHDAGMLTDGRVFYVMKLVKGERLEDFARRASVTELLRLFLRACEAVGFAHAAGVVHRDLKPSNIMVGAFGEVLVLDWGIARVMPDERETSGGAGNAGVQGEVDTAAGAVLGTPGFMAPEQAQGWSHLVDARSDVYALGAILRSLLEREPGRGAVARPLRSIWRRALAPDPADRYPSAAALAADVERYLDGGPVQAHRETPAELAGRVFRKYQTAVVLVLTYLVIRMLFLATRGL